MARIRTIKPDFFKNEELAELSAMARLLFIGLWTQADREGRLEDRPKRIKAELFPYDNIDVDKALTDLHNKNFIVRYKGNVNISDRVLPPEQPTNEVACIQIVTFNKHQKIDNYNEKESQLPECQELNSLVYKKTIASLLKDGERKGKEGKGREEKPNGFSATEKQKISFQKFEAWIQEEVPEVAKMSKPFTITEYVKLTGEFPEDKHPSGFRPGISKHQVIQYLQAIENNREYLKKYRSPYLCVLAWHKNNKSK